MPPYQGLHLAGSGAPCVSDSRVCALCLWTPYGMAMIKTPSGKVMTNYKDLGEFGATKSLLRKTLASPSDFRLIIVLPPNWTGPLPNIHRRISKLGSSLLEAFLVARRDLVGQPLW